MHNNINSIREALGLQPDDAVDVEEHRQGDAESDDGDEGELVCFVCLQGDVSEGNDILICDGPHSHTHATKSAATPPWSTCLRVRGFVLIVRLKGQQHQTMSMFPQWHTARTLHKAPAPALALALALPRVAMTLLILILILAFFYYY